MDIDIDLGVSPEETKRLILQQAALVQAWIDGGINLNAIMYTLGFSFCSLVDQCGTPPHEVERLKTDILKWINGTVTMQAARGQAGPVKH